MPPDKGKKIVIIRKKKVAGGGHHGGSWKVAYADFVTAMMAFFMGTPSQLVRDTGRAR